MRDLAVRKETMLANHLMARGIRDPAVIAAMREVPREDFIAPELREHAYDDTPLPIGAGQTISQPFIVAYMIEALELSPKDRALEIGTGSGYAAAVLSRVAAEVYTVERLANLAREAEARLQSLGYTNIHVLEGDGTVGWAEKAPFDAIVVTAGAPDVPEPLLDQLAVDGRLVIPVGSSYFYQELVRVRRVGTTEYRREYLTDVRFVPLIGAKGWRE
ncbi:MAG TPA: protein-L-isoaspartate(D-aspartate) O-methyltransferase [Geobacteraceae bacterium]